MAIAIKDTATIAGKFARRAAAAGSDYKDGLSTPKHPQAESAIAAKAVWQAAIEEAASRDAYAKGLQKSGNEKWLRKAQSVGAQRYPDGVRAAQPDYAAGVAPYFDVLRNLTLPARGLKGTNAARVDAVVTALRKAKTGR